MVEFFRITHKDDGLMRQGMSSRRARGRNNSRGRQQNIRNQQMDSNGPGSRIRGTPQQILDRYLALARDCMSSGDAVLYENLMQHAEHYSRLLNASAPQQQPQQNANQGDYQNGRDDYDDESGYGQSESGDDMPAANGRSAEHVVNGRERSPNFGEAEQPPTPEVWNGIEQTVADPPQSGDQQASPPRRRRRSRYQRNQDQAGGDGSEGASGEETSSAKQNGHAREAYNEPSPAQEFAGGNDATPTSLEEPAHRDGSSDS
jgi:hypothetical protein